MGQNNYPPSADQTIRELQQRVKALEAAAQTRAPLNTVTGGAFKVQDAAGNTYLLIGQVQPNLHDGSPQYGVSIYRQNGDESVGQLALQIADGLANVNDPPIQTVHMYDIAGNQVWGDDAVAGVGIARPYLSFPMGRSDEANWVGTTSGSMTDMYFGFPPAQQPKVYVSGYASSPTGTNGQIQLVSGSTVLGGPISVAGNSSAVVFWSIGPVAFPAAVGAAFLAPTDLRVQAARTAGTGNFQVCVGTSYGQQS